MKRLSLFCMGLLLFLPLAATADDGHQHYHGPSDRVGKVSFPTSCDKSVQPAVEQAVAMLHSFWYDGADKGFRAVTEKDPECAMAYWGIAMSLHHPLWTNTSPEAFPRATEAVAKAKAAKHTSARERAYIDAIAEVYAGGPETSLLARNQRWAAAMEKVHKSYPQDREAAIFYALALRATAPHDDKSYAIQRKVGTIIDPLFEETPEHPGLAHYVIHNYDYPELAHLGLSAARRYAKIAPDSAHALHMPSHIFIRLGLWEDAIQSNQDSARVAREQAKKAGSAASVADQLHALDYLAYAYLQRGEVKNAKRILHELRTADGAEWSYFSATYAAAATPARLAMEMHRWADARDLPEPTFKGGSYWTQVAHGIVYWARAVGAARTGAAERATQDIAHLERLREQLAAKGHRDGVDNLEIFRLSANGWLKFAAGEHAEGLRLVRAAADLEDRTDKHPVTPGPVLPAREQVALMLMELERPAEALREFEASLKMSPNRFHALAGAARAAAQSGDASRAKQYQAQLRKVAPNADPELMARVSSVVAAER